MRLAICGLGSCGAFLSVASLLLSLLCAGAHRYCVPLQARKINVDLDFMYSDDNEYEVCLDGEGFTVDEIVRMIAEDDD